MRIDFHGRTLEDAVSEFEKIIGETRINRKSQEVEFVVGHGVIKKEFVKLLENYGIEYTIGFNQGVIKAVIE